MYIYVCMYVCMHVYNVCMYVVYWGSSRCVHKYMRLKISPNTRQYY